jgi:hypothetical protein
MTFKSPGVEDRRLGFVKRDTPRLRGEKADDDALERAVVFVKEQIKARASNTAALPLPPAPESDTLH